MLFENEGFSLVLSEILLAEFFEEKRDGPPIPEMS
jgi:hypothetical protein